MMEASLQKNKAKKHRTKYKQTSSDLTPLEDIKLPSCDKCAKIDDEKIAPIDDTEINLTKNESHHMISSRNESSSKGETLSEQNVFSEDLDNIRNDIHQNTSVSQEYDENKSREICKNANSDEVLESNVNPMLAYSSLINTSIKDTVVQYPSIDAINLEKLSLKTKDEIKQMELNSLVRYPDIKSLEHCKKIHNIVSHQVLVQNFIDKYQIKIAIEANKAFQDFYKEVYNLDQHPLMDMVHQYHRAKRNCSQLRSRLKYLKSHVKRNKDDLWKTVKKEVTAKGKCEDGYSVTIKHLYTIKELDEVKFKEVKQNLREIQELILAAAFYSYSEELDKLRIEDHINNLIYEKEKSKGSPKTVLTLQKSVIGEESDSLKKCISVLFESQRQNAEDKDYLETCQKLLKTLVSSLIQERNFKDNLFLLNHVIRCPNGIGNWASHLIQVPIDECENGLEKSDVFECICAERILLALYLILSPVPFKDYFLRNIKDVSAADSNDRKFTVLDSDGEEEDILEMSRNWSVLDIISLLNQIPVRRLFKHILLDSSKNNDDGNNKDSEDRMLKLFAYARTIIDILCIGLETYHSENFTLFFESISNLIRHILLYMSEYYIHYMKVNTVFKSENQAVYDKLFFHVVFKIYNFKKLHVLRILPALPYNNISGKIFWNILWIFCQPGRSEEEVYSEKDVELKIKDEHIHSHFLNYIKKFSTEDLFHLLNTMEKIVIPSNCEEDFMKFTTFLIFKITVLDDELRKRLCNEGSIILSAICEFKPSLISVLLKEINDEIIANQSINLFKKICLLNWIPQDCDINILSSWLLSNVNKDENHLARIIFKKLNYGFNEESSLFLTYDLHRKIAAIITEAYLLFDANNSEEGLISKGVKQMLQFTALGSYEDDREDFAQFAWNILFMLKLHPLDKKSPPLLQVYEGSVEECDKNSIDLNVNFPSVVSAYEKKHPAGCYLMIVMTNEGCNMKSLLKTGMECLQSLVLNEQYMAAIKLLHYLLPFFVKHPEDLYGELGFLKAMYQLITADLTVISSIIGEPVIGAVLHQMAAMMKHQLYKAGQHTIEFSVPLLKLWIQILMKMLLPSDRNLIYTSKNSVKQIYFLLDLLVKISFLHDYTRTSIFDLFDSFCSAQTLPKTTQSSIFKRLFSSETAVYPILNQNRVPEYPFLSYYVLLSEMKQKAVQDLWLKVETEMLKQNDSSPSFCLKKVSDGLKIPLEFLPIYRWALQAVATPVSSPICPLIYQQFFLYFFHKIPLLNSELGYTSIGMKYFKSQQSVSLFQKIKNHLLDAENYYRNLAKQLNMEGRPLKNSDSEYRSIFLLNLLKCFGAFRLWVEDDSLQVSRLCLSALEPKYLPDRLKLILNGDQNLWMDLVYVSSLKDEIDQKVHSYDLDKNTNNMKVPKSAKQESLPDQMTRHLKVYESVLPPLKYEHCDAIHTIHEENCKAESFSKEAILKYIEQNQSIIYDKAKFFCDQMERLKQLNFNYINWTPQEYKVEPCEINERRVCYKGYGAKGCSGAASFKLQIEKYSRNERIAERIDNNRAEYLINHDQLSKLPLKDLCIASLRIENFIRSLSKKMKEAENGKSDCFKKMGIALFYHQVSSIDKTLASVAGYPPSRQFFSSIIESLGKEFIDGDESELTDLAKSILRHPESGSLALPLFSPNNSTVLNFLKVYGELTSSVCQQSANSLLALFSKIDLLYWLNENVPSFDDRKEIFECISQALKLCGSNPVPELLPVFEIIKRHFRVLLQYMFPDFFLEAVSLLIKGTEDQDISVDIYYEAFHCFGCPLFDDKTSIEDIQIMLKKFAENQHLPANQQIFISVARLNLQQVYQASSRLYEHFMKRRISMKQSFYKRYASYIKPIGIFLAIVSHSLISLRLDELSGMNDVLFVSDLWDSFHHPFVPWIHPTENSSNFDFPWTNEELDHAHYMFKIFVVCLKYFHEKTLSFGANESVLSYLWNFYVQVYVTPDYRHYSMAVCHSELIHLPWNQFYPCTQDIEGMCKVLRSNLQESKEFLSFISLQIPWSEVMQNVSLTRSPDYVGKVLATLGKLLIISQMQHSKENDDPLSSSVFKDFENLSWNFLCLEDVEALLNLFYNEFDPIIFLRRVHNCPEYHVLQFLKVVCCLVTNVNTKEFSNIKQILYLKKFLSAVNICSLSKIDEVKELMKEFKEIISSLLGEVDNAICNGVNSSEQIICALPLVKEFITFLNDLSGNELDIAAKDSITSYLLANKQSPLLLPCLKVSSANLKSVSLMVPLIECCIHTRFVDETPDPFETSKKWQLISSYFCVPSKILEDFVRKCVEENAFLTLYCYILHKLPLCESTEKKIKMLQQIILWIRESKLRPSAEAKFLLLWDKLLELCINLVLIQEYQVVRQELMSFSWILESLAEDRSNSGFFALIGFGQASTLSVNFRFLCRVMAAFIQYQIPDNCIIRLEPARLGLSTSHGSNVNASESNNVCDLPSSGCALKALENLKALEQKKLYSALQSQISYAIQCISNSKYTLLESREFLKYFAAILYPKDSFLAILDV